MLVQLLAEMGAEGVRALPICNIMQRQFTRYWPHNVRDVHAGCRVAHLSNVT